MKYLESFFAFLILAGAYGVVCAQDGSKPVPTDQMVAAQTQSERYRIGFQDVLEVQVYRHPELTQRVLVSPTGTISLFRLDEPVTAACKTEGELEDAIENAYRAKFLRDPQVKVLVAEQRSQPIGVMGAVEKAGNFFVTRRTHLLEMLAMAGGPKEEAGTRLIVARTGNTTSCRSALDTSADDNIEFFSFKLRDVQEGKKTLWMRPGDIVSLLTADPIYLYGNVNKQGMYPIREQTTLTQAIATAEGLKRSAKKDKVRILRQRPNSDEREELVYDLNAINTGKIKDPILEPNDIVAVSEDRTKAILAGLGDVIKGAVPNAAYRFP